MPKLRELIIGITILAVLIYGGVYAYMYNKVKTGVDTLSLQAMIAGNFQYGGISVSPLSSAFSIDDIRFTPNGFQDPLKIDSLHVEVDSLLKLMDLSTNISPDMDFPQQGEILFNGMHVPLDADWLRKLTDETMQQISDLEYKPQLCGGAWYVGPDQLKAMGYKELLTDFRVSFYHDTTLGQMDNEITLTLRDIGKLDYKLVTSAPFDSRITSFARMGEPELQYNQLTYRDLSYISKKNRYCAEASNLEVGEYIDARVNQSDADYVVTWGFVPGEGIRQGYKRFLTNPGELSFTIDPASSFNLGALHLYNPKDIPAVLSLRVKVNGKEITDLGFKTIDEVQLDTDIPITSQYSFTGGLGELGSLLQPTQKSAEEKPPVTTKKKQQARYRVISINEIHQHIGQEVRIHVTSGLVREGTLERIRGSNIHVSKSLRGGKITMPIPYGRVSKVEVLD